MLKFFVLLLCLAPFFAQAATHPSDLREVRGVKFPNSAAEGSAPVVVSVLALRPHAKPQGFTELLEYVLRSPDQEEAGSCLYMSLTGIAEWWLAKLKPRELRTPDGPIDLSERYLMNVAGLEEDQNGIPNWKTDSIYLFNKAGGTLKNIDYRFTKGWFTTDADGNYHAAIKDAPGSSYGVPLNWVDQRETVADLPLVRLPRFKREVLFADPESNQWNTGVMPSDIVERVKTALRENKAPVQVIYNHFGYWHATVIVGFDDDLDNQDCSFVRHFLAYMGDRVAKLRAEAAQATDPQERERLLHSADKAERAQQGAQRSFAEDGGCHPRGSFYVRDSIYRDENGPIYDYDPVERGEEAPYGKSTVLLEYDWLRSMANHATQILVE